MKKNKAIIPVVIVILAVAAGGWLYLKKKSSPSEEMQKIVSPFYGDIQTIITTTASVLPKNRLAIKPPVNGRVDQILVKEGDMVKTGQILAWMSSTDRAALLDSARGLGEKEFQHWQDVYKAIPLLAPIDGQVIVATIQPGQTVTSSEAIVVLSDRLIVRGQVDETDIGRIKLDQKAVVSLDSYPDTRIPAVVDHIYYESTTVNNVTIYYVDLIPEEVPAFFRSGMNANVDFILQKKEHILLLPAEAVIKKEEGSFVLLQSPQNAKGMMKEIQTGISDDRNVEITSDLKETDQVIIKTKKFSLNKAKSGSNPFMATGRSGGTSGGRGGASAR